MVKLLITENEANQRLDRFLRKYLKRASLSGIYRMIRKDVKLNGRRAGEDTMLKAGDELALYITDERLAQLTAERKKPAARKQFRVIYEDEDILIVDKPRGLLTHGDSREKKNTLANQVCGYLQEKGDFDPASEKTFTPAPVNRLDRNTTGLVIFGKNAAALRELTQLIRRREGIGKFYLTIVCGCFDTPAVFEDRMAKDEAKNISQVTADGGKAAVTRVRPVRTGERFSLVEAGILTGRTHQIRVHLANAGFPLAGDAKYGDRRINGELRKYGITTQLLHAYRLEFADIPQVPQGLRGRIIEAPAPENFARAEKLLIRGKD